MSASERRLWTPGRPTVQETDEGNQPLIYRQVEGRSVDMLNGATQGIRGKKIERVLDVFTLGLAQSYKIERARRHSPLARPPRVEDVAGELLTAAASLAEPVTASVVDIKQSHHGVALHLDYDSHFDEQHQLAAVTKDVLRLPAARPIGPHDAYIVLLEGQLPRQGQTAQLSGLANTLLGEEIRLSAARGPGD